MHSRKPHIITVFEHDRLYLGNGEQNLSANQLKALQEYHGTKGVPWFTLIHNGVKFCEYVGILQVGNLLIEVLPKADRNTSDKAFWRDVLIDMVRVAGFVVTKETSESRLRIRPNSILELYFERFVSEANYLLHTGLVKQYRPVSGNRTSLKGAIDFPNHLRHNLIHAERFYVRHTIYDTTHLLHAIIYKTILLLQRINTNPGLYSPLANLSISFPFQENIKISADLFKRITYNRKTRQYEPLINICKLILLNYHPDISKGHNDVLALMFDMNSLWEQFIYVTLRAQLKETDSGLKLRAQKSRNFWQSDQNRATRLRPDIIIERGNGENVIIDTKWKLTDRAAPTDDDLRQMFTYNLYFSSSKAALLYPGSQNQVVDGNFYKRGSQEELSQESCAVITLKVEDGVRQWQREIGGFINNWLHA